MKAEDVSYDDWGEFIVMTKRDWSIIKKWLAENGVKLAEEVEKRKPSRKGKKK